MFDVEERFPGRTPYVMAVTILFAMVIAFHTGAVTADPATTEARMAYTKVGSGAPTVVLESGLGDGQETWADLSRRLRDRYTVVTYDRPGYGHSSRTTGPRDPCTIAADLHQMLQAADIRPPYLLVGHSLGGLYQYAFAKLYPEDVAGAVLLDPTHPRHWESMQRDAPSAARLMRIMRATTFGPVVRAEFDQLSVCNARLDDARALEVPASLLVSTRFQRVEGPEFQRMLGVLRQDWLRLSGAAVLQSIASGHYIHRDAPGAVIEAIDSIATRHGTGGMPSKSHHD